MYVFFFYNCVNIYILYYMYIYTIFSIISMYKEERRGSCRDRRQVRSPLLTDWITIRVFITIYICATLRIYAYRERERVENLYNRAHISVLLISLLTARFSRNKNVFTSGFHNGTYVQGVWKMLTQPQDRSDRSERKKVTIVQNSQYLLSY